MRKQVIRLSIHQTSKVIAILYFLMTLIFTIPAAIVLYIQSQDPAFFLFFIYPFVFAIVTYISTVILGWFYNLVSKSFGGIEFVLEEQDD